jgi:adenosylcobyric acid synthase
MRAKAIMVLGTMSDSGKSTIAAALCRIAFRKGLRVAPFKAQNMSLNSHVTPEGGEIGRAQAVQARAAGIESHTDMNPVLLKPTGEGLMQVIVDGKAIGNSRAREYYARKGELKAIAHRAYDRLAARYDLVVLEGAGSPAEINLRDGDFVNGSMAEHAGADCILVADIDRGGVFASILGTITLLPPRQRALLKGILINKFRGDATLLEPGLREIEGLTGVPVLGVLPYLENLRLEQEDSLGLAGVAGAAGASGGGRPFVDLAVIRLPYISNFTDFQPFESAPGVGLRYVSRPEDLGNPDLVFLPGTKNVRHDMEFLARTGLDRSVRAAAARSIPVLGICGGYQMLGRSIRDPHGVEGNPGVTEGLGLLGIETVLETEKELARVEARNLRLPFLREGEACGGYEIHAGRTTAAADPRAPLAVTRRNGAPCEETAGAGSGDGLIQGHYLHGFFDGENARTGLLRWLAARKGLDWRPLAGEAGHSGDGAFDLLADAVSSYADLSGFI